MLVLERLSDARRNGHEVLAVVRGSAVNQDGASNGLTAPNGPSQQRVIRARARRGTAHRRRRGPAGGARHRHHARRPDRGPGAARHLRPGPARGHPAVARLGEVQHRATQAAAGVAGIIKAVMAMRHRVPAQDAARRRADHQGRLGAGAGPAADGEPALARPRPAAPRRRLLLRRQRHQRAHHPGGGPRRGTGGTRAADGAAAGALGDLRPDRARPARTGRPPGGRRRRAGPGGRGALPWPPPAPPSRTGPSPRRRPRRAPHGHDPGRRGRSGRRLRPGPQGTDRLPVHRAGRTARRHGPRTARPLPGVRPRLRRDLRTDRRRRTARPRPRRRPRAAAPHRPHPDRPCSPSKSPCTGCWSPGASPPTTWPDTPSARSPPPTWPASSTWPTRPRWWPRAAGLTQALPRGRRHVRPYAPPRTRSARCSPSGPASPPSTARTPW